ncbi:hypothetical protein BCF33_0120 [Hasllibacter halocynthiae]|uniref:Uncharacterized protein n=1 Tax=Hasllibacter halocynthiae TaxID=595589 RepID=A0A2T0X6H0_9RHOB|nr:hypothetical protein [Hasllibacter halocynthiae]PRY94529.1 hypothetical protein BCF33_0120 [Hasllibacter halocynthiae]
MIRVLSLPLAVLVGCGGGDECSDARLRERLDAIAPRARALALADPEAAGALVPELRDVADRLARDGDRAAACEAVADLEAAFR